MKGYHIYFIRCGLTKANEENIYCGITDFSLSPKGMSNLYQMKENSDYPNIEQVFSAPLKRCTESASIIFPNTPILSMSEFNELDLGDFENKSSDELVNDENFKAWLKGEQAPPNGETLTSLTTRSFEGLNKIIREMMNEDLRNVAVVTTSGVITNICTSFGIPKYAPQQLFLAPGEGIETLVTAQLWLQAQALEILEFINKF
ncbi:MAG: phosphoglycerate mutase family protein [Oscillospiraceae bacterium]|nr:phosphoglycerate mutase family protein [Oscillospiraceae bacterium]